MFLRIVRQQAHKALHGSVENLPEGGMQIFVK